MSQLFAGGSIYTGDEEPYEDSNAPKAFLNYILLDNSFNLVDFGYDQVANGATASHDLLSLKLKITQPGYLYVYLSNENNTPRNVYFDDFKIKHTHIDVIQATDYYTFGMDIKGTAYNKPNAFKNQFKYNGMEAQDELDLGLYDYGARMYMPDIGRWGVLDPLAEKDYGWSPYKYAYNNPLLFIDPDGKGEVYGMSTDQLKQTGSVSTTFSATPDFFFKGERYHGEEALKQAQAADANEIKGGVITPGIESTRTKFDKNGRQLNTISFRKAVRVVTKVTIHDVLMLDQSGDMGGTKRDATQAELIEAGELLIREIQNTWNTDKPQIDQKGREVSINIVFEGKVRVINSAREATKRDFLITLTPYTGQGPRGAAGRGSNHMTINHLESPLGVIMNRNDLLSKGYVDPGRNGVGSHEFGHLGNLPDRKGSVRSIMNGNYNFMDFGPSFKDRWNFFRGR